VSGASGELAAAARPPASPLLEVDDLTVSFGSGPGSVRAVENVSLRVAQGDAYALVGESGCGKSTLAYTMLNIIPPPGRVTGGEVRFKDRVCTQLRKKELNRLRGPEIAMVFQAAMNSFNPVLTIGRQVEHILEAHPGVFPGRKEGRAYFKQLLEMFQLPADRVWRSYESQLSGGMKQRVAIAVALLLKPSLVVLDEPTTALDVLNQRLIIQSLKDLHKSLGLTIVFVTHDLAVVAELASHVAVMYAGRLVESGTVAEVFSERRRHPYVAALIDAIPSVLDDGLDVRPIPGQVPNLAELPPGCRFAARCPLAEAVCREREPALLADERGHQIACHVVNRELGVVRA
jgi:peptide/nickel transport system ATP-binding protein